MALIKCKECGKEISSEAVACPECGNPVKPVKREGVASATIKVVLTLIAIGLFIFIVIPAFCVSSFMAGMNSKPERAKTVEKRPEHIEYQPDPGIYKRIAKSCIDKDQCVLNQCERVFTDTMHQLECVGKVVDIQQKK